MGVIDLYKALFSNIKEKLVVFLKVFAFYYFLIVTEILMEIIKKEGFHLGIFIIYVAYLLIVVWILIFCFPIYLILIYFEKYLDNLYKYLLPIYIKLLAIVLTITLVLLNLSAVNDIIINVFWGLFVLDSVITFRKYNLRQGSETKPL